MMTVQMTPINGPHQGQPILTAGGPLDRARAGGGRNPVGRGGGLIGPDGAPRDYPGALDGAPVFLGCRDVDFHVPKERVHETAAVLRRLGGEVTVRLYPNMDHAVNQDELEFVRGMMSVLSMKH